MFENWEEDNFYAWLAGFWEGEGSLTKVNKKWDMTNRYVLRISQKQISVLESIQHYLGKGYIYGERPRINSHSPSGMSIPTFYITRTDDVLYVLDKIIPYLTFRKEYVQERFNLLKYHRENNFHSRHPFTREEKSIIKNCSKIKEIVKLFPDRSYGTLYNKKKHMEAELIK